MKRARVTASWIIILGLILSSANSFVKSGGDSIDAWALLLLIPVPLIFIISNRSITENTKNIDLEEWNEDNDEKYALEKNADDPLESGFDIPIL
ncbi:MAG: hypothetical protein NLN66_02550 [Candidatus Thalassarchaeaceae archaeon]|nr:hypothetical protein [Candidatus Thalassarchaeaceae archaeon]